MIKRIVFCAFLVFFSVAFFAPEVLAAEQIRSYDVEIRLNQDASATVTEKISLTVKHKKIKRGIYRDLKKTGRMSYDVVEVLRDSRKELFFIETDGSLFRINTGGDKYIPKGDAVFTITYRVRNILKGFKNHDELYWNVTGNHWSFPIERATAKIIAPDGATATEYKSFQGVTKSTAPASFANGVFSSTTQLYPGEGLTVAVGYAKGFFSTPKPLFDPDALLKAAYVILFAYLGVTWYFYGRDPEKGAIMPRYDILPKISPAFEGYIAGYGTDPERLAAIALLQGCVSKFLKITPKEKKSFVVDKLREPQTKEEKIIDKTLSFPQKISSEEGMKLNNLQENLALYYSSRSPSYFESNTFWLLTAYCVFFVLTALLFFLTVEDPTENEVGIRVFIFFFILLSAASYHIQKRICAGRLSFQIPFFLFVLFLQSFVFLHIFFLVCPLPVFIFSITGTIALAVYGYLIKRPFDRGTKILEHLDGIKMFLDAVNLYPETFDDMEKLLPFAVLLGMEKQYNRKTKELIEKFHMAPQWFYDMPHYTRFTSSYASFSAPVARSGSGVGGGGFSGGGGGGFGGGGR